MSNEVNINMHCRKFVVPVETYYRLLCTASSRLIHDCLFIIHDFCSVSPPEAVRLFHSKLGGRISAYRWNKAIDWLEWLGLIIIRRRRIKHVVGCITHLKIFEGKDAVYATVMSVK